MSENSPEKGVIDPEYEKARKSMGSRVDPDPVIPKEPDEEPVAPIEPKKPEEGTPPEEPKEPVTEPPKEPVVETKKPINRPEAYIPLPKYHAEKEEWEKKATDSEAARVAAEAKVAELTALAGQKDGTQKDEDIEAFMETTGFDRETVDGFLKLAEKRLSSGQPALSQEQMEQINKATAIVKEAELESAFNDEFKTQGEPEVKKLFPNATEEQLEAVKKHLDVVAHTADNRDKPLDFLIFKNKDDIAKIFEEPQEPAPPQTKKTLEPTRMGNGKQTTLTATDFKEGGAGFEALGDLDQATRSQIIKDFDSTTYARYIQYAKNQAPGVEVMRNGQRVVLK